MGAVRCSCAVLPQLLRSGHQWVVLERIQWRPAQSGRLEVEERYMQVHTVCLSMNLVRSRTDRRWLNPSLAAAVICASESFTPVLTLLIRRTQHEPYVASNGSVTGRTGDRPLQDEKRTKGHTALVVDATAPRTTDCCPAVRTAAMSHSASSYSQLRGTTPLREHPACQQLGQS